MTLRAIIGLGLALAATPPAWAGGESSGGGADDYRVTSAFFRAYRDESPVSACYQAVESFGVTGRDLEALIHAAWAQWADYIPAKRLTIVPNGELIRTQLNLRPGGVCDGTESLVFYFGVQSPEISHFQSQFTKPFGFAQLVDEGLLTHQPRGLVWIAPPNSIDTERKVPTWNRSTLDALGGLLVHEVGHVFGNGHVDGTAMTEKISKYLRDDTSPTVASKRNIDQYARIDARIELVPCLECRAAYSAAETFDPTLPPGQSSDWDLTFRELIGRAPVAPLLIRFERMGSPQGSGRLLLMDALRSYTFPIQTETDISSRQDSTPLFVGQGGKSFFSFGISYYAQIRTQHESGEADVKIPVAMNYNMHGRKAEILPLGTDFYPRPIFVSAF